MLRSRNFENLVSRRYFLVLYIISCLGISFTRLFLLGREPCQEDIDVVITVHDSLRALMKCVQSLEASEINAKNSRQRCATVFVVDANSSQVTATYLKSKEVEGFQFLKYRYVKETSSSYTRAVNRGIASGLADTVIILNSDVVLPFSWISELTSALRSSSSVGVVGPLSNSACYQSVPNITPHHWSHNDLPETRSIEDVNDMLKRTIPPEYPPVPLLNGFAVALKRQVVEKVGYFDERLFPLGYGEENDFALRVRRAGFSLRVVDNLFIFHEKSASFGQSQRAKLIRLARGAYSDELSEYIRLAHEELLDHVTLSRARKVVSAYFDSSTM